MSEDTITLVTGASRGLGYAVAEALAGAGTHVVTVARTSGGLEELADAIEARGGASTLVPLDLTDDAGVQRMCRAIFERWGRIDRLVHCAAHAEPLSPAEHVTEKAFDRCMALNARATWRLLSLTKPLLLASREGHAIVATDDAGGTKFQTAYGASKAAQAAIVESLSSECRQTGPKITAFQPRPMPTALRARFHPGEDRSGLTPIVDEAARLAALF